jgi:hypothetical protein
MASRPIIPLRFQRAEIEKKAKLSSEAAAILARNPHPVTLLAGLREAGLARDGVYALVLMLPHRQVVWWGCLAARLLPDLDRRPADLACVAAAERWVQSPQAHEAEQAGEAAAAADRGRGPAWVATAASWAGPSLAPRGQQVVPPAPHLPGAATRSALVLLLLEPALAGRVTYADWLTIGAMLMEGDTGSQAQAALRQRLAGGA